MRTGDILPTLLCLHTAGAIPFVTNVLTAISYQGTTSNGVDHFQNITYAEDTSGANRFAPPKAYFPPRGSVVDATSSGNACPQQPEPISFFPFSSTIENLGENCLNLRIARPAGSPLAKSLPVMVWLHGGGYNLGQAYDRFYDPEGLVLESVTSGHPVIYVAIHYRVAMFGFATSGALHDAKSENNGLRDQQMALQWVKDNIVVFGGDPEDITVFGQSAGSISSGLQMVAFGGQQGAVFKKAIMNSGAITGNFASGPVATNTASVAKAVNCTDDPDSDATLDCLRDVPFETLLPAALDLAKKVSPPDGIGAFRPVIDGDFIPDQPSKLIKQGSFVKGISVIAAWTMDDGSIFIPGFINTDNLILRYFSRYFPAYTKDIGDQLLSLYPETDFIAQVSPNDTVTAQWYRAARIFRDISMACPSINLTRSLSAQSSPVSTYLYSLNSTRLQPVWDNMAQSNYRIAHVSDVPYYFNEAVEAADNSDAAMQFSADVSRSFSAFASSGDPSTDAFDWPVAWTGDGDEIGNATVFVLGGPYGSGPAVVGGGGGGDERSKALAQEKLVERCDFLDANTV